MSSFKEFIYEAKKSSAFNIKPENAKELEQVLDAQGVKGGDVVRQGLIDFYNYVKSLGATISTPLSFTNASPIEKIKLNRQFLGLVDIEKIKDDFNLDKNVKVIFGDGDRVKADLVNGRPVPKSASADTAGSGAKRAKRISFTGGKNTSIGESIQVCGLFMKNSDIKSYSAIVSAIKNVAKSSELGDPDGIFDLYLRDEKLYEEYKESFDELLRSSINAMQRLNIKPDGFIHASIDTVFKKVLKSRNFVSDLKKDNTADCVLYTGSDFLKNLANEENTITYNSANDDYRVFIKSPDGTELNTFIQISLKAGGRLGSSAAFSQIAKKHTHLPQNEGFIDFVKRFTKSVVNFVIKNIAKLKSFNKIFFRKLERFNDIFLKNSTFDLNEAGRKPSFPKIEDIIKYYSTGDRYDVLAKEIKSNIVLLKKELIRLGDGVVYKIPDYTPDANIPEPSVLRMMHFNNVSLKTLLEFLKDIKKASDIPVIEVELVYGNTSLPLVKLTASAGTVNNPVEFLPKELKNTVSNELPSFGVLINTEKNNYLVFYFFIMSEIKKIDNAPAYAKVQMRTSGNQYKVEGNNYESYTTIQKNFGL